MWFGLLGGPVAWTVHLFVSYMLVPVACDRDTAALLHLVTVGAVVVTLAAGAAAWSSWRRTGSGARTETGGAAGRSGFLALSGVLMSGLFLMLILVGGIPDFYLDPCR